MGPDKRALLSPTGCDIVVATPGRMLAHMQETPGVPQLCSGVKVRYDVLIWIDAVDRSSAFLPTNFLTPPLTSSSQTTLSDPLPSPISQLIPTYHPPP